MNNDPEMRNTRQPVTGRVSVIIPTYNYGNYLGDAVNSCLQQTYPDVETIVIDDGSTDNTRSVCEAFGDKITYIYQQNSGVSAARNTGLDIISGEYVTFLDSDDILTPESVSMRVNSLIKNPTLLMAMGGIVSIEDYDPSSTVSSKSVEPYITGKLYEDLLIGRFSGAGLLRSTTATRFRFPQKLTNGEDIAYFVKVSFGNKVCIMDHPVLIKRRHDGCLSRDFEKIIKQDMAIITTIMDDPYYGGKLDYLRKEFTSRRFLSLSRSMYLAGDDRKAVSYYLRAIKAKPASVLKLSRFMKFLKAYLRIAFSRNS